MKTYKLNRIVKLTILILLATVINSYGNVTNLLPPYDETDKCMLSFRTVSDLKKATGTEGQVAILSDRDRGGIFIYNSTAIENGGTVFGKWERLYDGYVNVKWFGAKGDGITDDTAAIQSIFTLGLDMYVPKGIYMVSELNNSFSNGAFTYNIHMDQEATFKVNNNASYVLKIDGTGGPDKNGAKFQANYLSIDGNKKQFNIDGLVLKHLTRARFGLINIFNIKGIGLNIPETVKETTFDTIRLYRCGTTSGPENFKAALSITKTNTSVNDSTNNLDINVFYGIYNYGPDIYIDAVAGVRAVPRKIRIDNFFIHGNLTRSDERYPLSNPERDYRNQIYIGASQDIHFGSGILIYGANLASHVKIASPSILGGKISHVRLVFEDLYIGERFSSSEKKKTYFHGITQETGTLYVNRMKATSSFNRHYVINSIGGTCVVNHSNITYNTGSLRISNNAKTYSPKIKGITNIASIKKVSDFTYEQVGSLVNVFGYVTIDPAQTDLASTFTKLSISLPIGVVDTDQQLVGNIASTEEVVNAPVGIIKADSRNERAIATFTSNHSKRLTYLVKFSYVLTLK